METKKRKEHSPGRGWRKFGSGCLLFGAGFISGSRIEVLLQNKGITPVQCEFITVGCTEPEQIQTKHKK